ncbi:hypothetical protein GCM10009425_47120 [Pseudomonas asuensis]|uniref:Uncharacterized protein n=1 Tax=Pseudomonas asuensis TaxID=1825787 RepID=A0ABQ2H393_9PSED|nr:hypothetical protein GCM10009425_47120 [Pseudomonas asuensis]
MILQLFKRGVVKGLGGGLPDHAVYRLDLSFDQRMGGLKTDALCRADLLGKLDAVVGQNPIHLIG